MSNINYFAANGLFPSLDYRQPGKQTDTFKCNHTVQRRYQNLICYQQPPSVVTLLITKLFLGPVTRLNNRQLTTSKYRKKKKNNYPKIRFQVRGNFTKAKCLKSEGK